MKNGAGFKFQHLLCLQSESNISYEILDALNLSYNDLNGKTLILDGFDEVSVGGNRKEILDQLYSDLIYRRNIYNFKLIVTCRENYIQRFERIKCRYITLQPWDEEQIHSFCVIFQRKAKCDISEHTIAKVIKSKEILGIPLILYMVLALNISIDKEGSIVDIYDKIFSLEGGIYDRCIESKNFADDHKVVGQIKKQIHQISREIAIWMFENKPVKAYIPQNEYENICYSVMKKEQNNKDIQQDALIGNFFKLRHCDGVGTEEIYFVHRSIYEYFVAEAIYSSIENAMLELSEECQKELAGNIAIYLKSGEITNTIGEYLQYKILKIYHGLDSKKQEEFYIWWENVVNMMMSYGMFYYTKWDIQNNKDIIAKEANCFENLIRILKLLLKTGRKKYIMESGDKKLIEKYIKLMVLETRLKDGAINLTNMCLEKICLDGVDLKGANLERVNLERANLERANLERANLYEANLERANLEKANLEKANLERANLKNANLIGADLEYANLKNTNLIGTNLTYANLKNVNLEKANLIEANLIGANLSRANLKDIEV